MALSNWLGSKTNGNRKSMSATKTPQLTQLRLWLFEITREGQLCVQGILADDESETTFCNWTSTVITERISSTHVVSQSGKHYELLGPLDEIAGKQKSHSEEVMAAFKNGFPPDWKDIIKKYYKSLLRRRSDLAVEWFDPTNPLFVGNGRKSMVVPRAMSEAAGRRTQSVAPIDKSASRSLTRRSVMPRSSLSVAPTIVEVEDEEPDKENRGTKTPSKDPVNKTLSSLQSGAVARRSPRLSVAPVAKTTNGTEKENGTNKTPNRGKSSTANSAMTPLRTPKEKTSRADKNKNTPDTANEDSIKTPKSQTNISNSNTNSKAVPENVVDVPRIGPAQLFTPSPARTKKSAPTAGNADVVVNQISIDCSPERTITVSNKSSENSVADVKAVSAQVSVPGSSVAHVAPAGFDNFRVPNLPQKGKPNFRKPKDECPDTLEARAVKLHDWHIRFIKFSDKLPVTEHPPFLLVGSNPQCDDPEGEWHSTIIVRVLSDKYFFTVRGSVYMLVNTINVPSSSVDGFSKDFVRLFFDGFPPNWLTLMNDMYRVIYPDYRKQLNDSQMDRSRVHPLATNAVNGVDKDRDSDTSDASRMHKIDKRRSVAPAPLEGKRPIAREFDRQSVGSTAPIIETPDDDSDAPVGTKEMRAGDYDAGIAHDVRNYNEQRDREMRRDTIDGDRRRRQEENRMALVPMNNGRQSTGEVRVSSSGRCVREPLAYWAGQRVRYSTDGRVVGVEDVKTKSIHTNGVADMSAVAHHYGMSPPGARSRSQGNRREPDGRQLLAFEVDGRLRMDKKRKRVTYADYSSDADGSDAFVRMLRTVGHSNPNEPYRKNPKLNSDEESEFEYEDYRQRKKAVRKQIRKLTARIQALQEVDERLDDEYDDRRLKKQKYREQQYRHAEFEERQDELERRQLQKRKHVPQGKPRTSIRDEEDEWDRRDRRPSNKEKPSRKYSNIYDEGYRPNGDSTDTEVEDSGDWRAPKTKKKMNRSAAIRESQPKQKSKPSHAQPKKQRLQEPERTEPAFSDDSDVDDQDEDDDYEEELEEVAKKPKSFSRDDVNRLKIAIDATGSTLRNDDDWEKVARALGGQWTKEECKNAAIKRLKWTPPNEKGAENNKAPEVMEVTARKGTAKFHVEAGNFTRKYMMGGSSQEDDFFRRAQKEKAQQEEADYDDLIDQGDDEAAPLPNVAEFDPDDSLLEFVKTPVVSKSKGVNRRAFIPEAFEDSPASAPRGYRRSTMGGEPDSADREQQDRYVHHLMEQKKNRSHNASRMGASFMDNSNYHKSAFNKTVENVGRKVGNIKKTVDKSKKKIHLALSEEDEDSIGSLDDY